jgi:HSP20 family protein
MTKLQQDLDRLLGTGVLFHNAEEARAGATPASRDAVSWRPPVDVVEDKDRIVLTADLPGVSLEQVEIQLHKDVLTVRGERKVAQAAESAETGELFRRFERVSGVFERSFTLPPTVDVDRIEAGMRDGVLTVSLPKRPEAQPRQIKVQGA